MKHEVMVEATYVIVIVDTDSEPMDVVVPVIE